MKMLLFRSSVILREVFATFITSLNSFMIGYSYSIVVYTKTSKDASSMGTESITGSLSIFTAIIGTFFFTYLANKFGRKISLLLVSINFFLASVVFFIFGTVTSLYINRVLVGIANGAGPLSMLYISEISDKSRRGTYVTSFIVMSILGVLCSYVSQYFLSIRMVSGITALLSIFIFVGITLLPETKYWYMIHNNREMAKSSIRWFDSSKSEEDIVNELNDIKIVKNENERSLCHVLRQCSHLKLFFIATVLYIFRTGCGREPIGVYGEDFFSHLQVQYDPKKTTLLVGCIEFVVGIFATLSMSKFKRRTLIFFAALVLIPSDCVLIISHFFINYVNQYVPWLIPVFASIYICACTAFLFPVISVVVLEVISRSNEYRNSIHSISYAIMTLSRAIFAAVFPEILNLFDISCILIFFLINNFLIIIWIVFFIPETANKDFHSCAQENNNDKMKRDDTP